MFICARVFAQTTPDCYLDEAEIANIPLVLRIYNTPKLHIDFYGVQYGLSLKQLYEYAQKKDTGTVVPVFDYPEFAHLTNDSLIDWERAFVGMSKARWLYWVRLRNSSMRIADDMNFKSLKLSNLEALFLYNTCPRNGDVNTFLEQFPEAPYLRSLSIGDTFTTRLTDSIRRFERLEILSLQLGKDTDWKQISSVLRALPHVYVLNILGADEGIRELDLTGTGVVILSLTDYKSPTLPPKLFGVNNLNVLKVEYATPHTIHIKQWQRAMKESSELGMLYVKNGVVSSKLESWDALKGVHKPLTVLLDGADIQSYNPKRATWRNIASITIEQPAVAKDSLFYPYYRLEPMCLCDDKNIHYVDGIYEYSKNAGLFDYNWRTHDLPDIYTFADCNRNLNTGKKIVPRYEPSRVKAATYDPITYEEIVTYYDDAFFIQNALYLLQLACLCGG